jgi:nitric oxide reductase large subunit
VTGEPGLSSADSVEAPLSPWWRHAVLLVMICGFSLLTVVTVLTYTNAPPVPRRVTDATGATLFTSEDIEHGQEVFLEWARAGADTVFLLIGVVPLVAAVAVLLWGSRGRGASST